MVQRKQARKKPKDLVVLDDEGLPGAGQVRRGDHSGGGGVRRPALAPLPNYMRATTCSGAKVDVASRKEAPPPPPTKVVSSGAAPRVGRATCSSTMKGGPGGAHVCSYAYCSLKGHAHAASALPLHTFLASRRRLIKTQQTMKLKAASPFRKPSNNGGGAEACFVEIRATAPPVGSGESCSGLSMDEIAEYVTFDHLSCGEDDAEPKAKDSADDSCGSSVVNGSLELLGSTKNRGRKDTETSVADHEDDYFGACKSDISEELDVAHQASIPEGEISDNACFSDAVHTHVEIGNLLLSIHDAKFVNSAGVGGDAPKEYSSDGLSNALSGISFEDVTSSECADAATSQRKKWHISGRRRTSGEGGKQMRPFKPKPPNFLPLETGPEAEKVDLRHQAVSDPRDAEEWMVDYALRKAVKKLARAQKRKVEMLVQAFETVLPTTVASEKEPVHRDGDKNSFALSRPSQACS